MFISVLTTARGSPLRIRSGACENQADRKGLASPSHEEVDNKDDQQHAANSASDHRAAVIISAASPKQEQQYEDDQNNVHECCPSVSVTFPLGSFLTPSGLILHLSSGMTAMLSLIG